MISYGCGFERINDYEIKHECNTESGSSGSPILNFLDNKVIAMHKALVKKKGINQYNIGTFLIFPLNDLNKKNQNNIEKLNKQFKIILVGDQYAGKDVIISTLLNKRDNNIIISEDNDEYYKINIEIKNKIYKILIWDISKEKDIKSILSKYDKKNFIVLAVYNIANRYSYDHIIDWINIIKNYFPNGQNIFMVGNKIEKEENRKVYYEEGKSIADIYEIKFYEMSCSKRENIINIFNDIINSISKNLNKEKNNNNNDKNFYSSRFNFHHHKSKHDMIINNIRESQVKSNIPICIFEFFFFLFKFNKDIKNKIENKDYNSELYYLINFDFIDNIKKIYNYKAICNELEKYNYINDKDFDNKYKDIIKSIKQKGIIKEKVIIDDIDIIPQVINFYGTLHNVNFTIINEKIFIIIMKIQNDFNLTKNNRLLKYQFYFKPQIFYRDRYFIKIGHLDKDNIFEIEYFIKLDLIRANSLMIVSEILSSQSIKDYFSKNNINIDSKASHDLFDHCTKYGEVINFLFKL